MGGGFRRSRDAAGRTHDQRFWKSRRHRGVGERTKVAGDDRPQVRVGDGRRGTLVLPELWSDLVRGDDVCVRQPAPELRGDLAFVRRIAVGVQETDPNRVGLECRQRVEDERLELSGRAQAALHAVTPLEWHKRIRPGGARPVEVCAGLAAQVEEMLETGGADEGGLRSFSLE